MVPRTSAGKCQSGDGGPSRGLAVAFTVAMLSSALKVTPITRQPMLKTNSITRRSVCAAGLGGMAALAWAPQGRAAPAARSAEEEANAKLVELLIQGWTKKDYDPKVEMARFISSPCVVRVLDTQPAIASPDAVAQVFIEFMKDGSRVSRVAFHQIMARGKMVITSRDDFCIRPYRRGHGLGFVLIKQRMAVRVAARTHLGRPGRTGSRWIISGGRRCARERRGAIWGGWVIGASTTVRIGPAMAVAVVKTPDESPLSSARLRDFA